MAEFYQMTEHQGWLEVPAKKGIAIRTLKGCEVGMRRWPIWKNWYLAEHTSYRKANPKSKS